MSAPTFTLDPGLERRHVMTERQIRLVENLLNPDLSQREAYEQAGYAPNKNPHKQIKTITSRPHIAAYLRERRGELLSDSARDNYLSIQEKRKYLAEVLRLNKEDYDPKKHGHLVQKISYGPHGITLQFPNAVHVIKLDNEMDPDYLEDPDISKRMEGSSDVQSIVSSWLVALGADPKQGREPVIIDAEVTDVEPGPSSPFTLHVAGCGDCQDGALCKEGQELLNKEING